MEEQDNAYTLDRPAHGLKMNIGWPSVMILLTILGLSLFAVLSLRAAYSERKLALASANSAVDYYEADRLAEEELFELMNSPDESYEDEIFEYPIDDNRYIEAQIIFDDEGCPVRTSKKVVSYDLDGYDGIEFEPIMFR